MNVTFPSSCRLTFYEPKRNEWRVMSGAALETNCSDCMPRFLSYHWVVLGMEATVRTRWSRDLMCAAGWEGIFLIC